MAPAHRSSLCPDCLALKRAPHSILLPDHLQELSPAERRNYLPSPPDIILFECLQCHALWLYAAQRQWFMHYLPQPPAPPAAPAPGRDHSP